MLTRRRFVEYSALSSAMLASRSLLPSGFGQTKGPSKSEGPLKLAVLGSVYQHQSQLQMMADRFLVGYPWQGAWHTPEIKVVSLYVDELVRQVEAAPSPFQLAMSGTKLAPSSAAKGIAGGLGKDRAIAAQPTPEKPDLLTDLGKVRAKEFGFRVCSNIPEALRCGGDRIAVDAVLTVVEQNDYPSNRKGQALLPTYDFFQQCAQVFETEGRAVPYFNHQQLSYSFAQAAAMVSTAGRLKIPFMAGSSMPVTWRLPDVDMPEGAEVQEAVMAIGGGGLEFDALEALQCMLERRKGGETGVKAVQVLEGSDVWAAGHAGRWSHELLSSALSRSDTPLGLTVLDGRTQDLVAAGVLPQLVKDPTAYCIEYSDGTRATLLVLDGAIMDMNFSARVAGHGLVSTQFFRSPAPNDTFSACLAGKVEQMFLTQSAPWPVERTLLTSGLMEACVDSRFRLNQRIETPQLAIAYKSSPDSHYERT